jgi:hypothetical protein
VGVSQERHSLLCAACSFYPEIPAPEKKKKKKREKEEKGGWGASAVGKRDSEEQSKTLKEKEEPVLESTGGQCTENSQS